MRRVNSARGAVLVCSDLAELSRQAADLFAELSAGAISRAGRFDVSLSGGSTPQSLYQILGEPPFNTQVPWNDVRLFWSDERCVPPDRPDSNFRVVNELLLRNISIPQENVHRIRGEDDPEEAAASYESVLRKEFHLPAGAWPRFDLILLGMGPDGHMASLFPGTAALAVSDRLVAANYVASMGSTRVTLTLPVINHAANVAFLVSGRAKASALHDVLQENNSELPASRVRPNDGRVTWIVDEDALKT